MAGFVTCGPNEALVVSGCCHDIPLIIPGGRVFVWPLVQSVQKISLNTMTLSIESPKVYTSQGVPISVTGIAQVKIQGQNKEMLKAACEQFLGKKTREIMAIARETLEGHQRAIMCTMSVEEIYKDRKKFSKQVFEVASSDLVNMGITVVSYTIKDIRDDEGYLKALGMARTAEVKRDARIGEAEAKRDAQIQEGTSSQQLQLDLPNQNREPDILPKRCKFFEAGKCFKGEKCHFSHDLQSPSSPQIINQKVCRNFLNGNCRYKTKCRYSHPPEDELFCPNRPCILGENCGKLLHWQECRHCHQFCLHPRNKGQRHEHRQACSEFLKAQALYKMTLGIECGICYEEVCTKEEDDTFGILPNCQHAFCYQCITNWRKQSSFKNDIKRGCPECRVISPFVIRTKRWSEGEAKVKLVEKHAERMKQIPCRNFTSKGRCPFKDSCLYKHE